MLCRPRDFWDGARTTASRLAVEHAECHRITSDQALAPRLVESFQILARSRRADGIAVVGWTLGQSLMEAGRSNARTVISEALAAAMKTGQAELAQAITDLLDSHS
jgi:hypothetical protein